MGILATHIQEKKETEIKIVDRERSYFLTEYYML